jgi:hypothetical protein
MAKRVDNNQKIIVAALRNIGAAVLSLAPMGKGCPDLLVSRLGINYLLEVKSEDGKLTPDEQAWHDSWCGQVAIVRTVEEAIDVVMWGGYDAEKWD